jgi:hypothetical protein
MKIELSEEDIKDLRSVIFKRLIDLGVKGKKDTEECRRLNALYDKLFELSYKTP